jgi:hypothetical protein
MWDVRKTSEGESLRGEWANDSLAREREMERMISVSLAERRMRISAEGVHAVKVESWCCFLHTMGEVSCSICTVKGEERRSNWFGADGGASFVLLDARSTLETPQKSGLELITSPCSLVSGFN